jgi:hypothetical protein
VETTSTGRKTLHATLYEIERGLFQVSYRADFLENEKFFLPPFQVAASASDARRHIEQKAREQRYEEIIWDAELVAPAVPPMPA